MTRNNFRPNCYLRSARFPAEILFGLMILIPWFGLASTLEVPPAAGGEGIQEALEKAGVGGQVVLGRGTYLVHQPIILRENGQGLRGAGPETILSLADSANCPVIILGPPKDKANGPTHGLKLGNLLVDGNR